MADEQTPQSDLVDDAIRQAERQLEEKLEALRMSALGEPSRPTTPPADDVAVLRPTGGPTRTSERTTPAPRATEAAYMEPADVVAPSTSWHEAGGEDLTFAPAEGSVTLSGNELYVPDADDRAVDDSDAAPSWSEPGEPLTPAHEALSTSVTGLTPVWDDDEESFTPPAPRTASRARAPREESTWDRPEPVHNAWTAAEDSIPTPAPMAAPAPSNITVVPSEEEMQFWAHTRTALRNLQQVTAELPEQMVQDVTGQVERIVRDEFAPTDATLRAVQQQLQQALPKLADRLEGAIEQALVAPNNGIRQVRDDLPAQIDRASREQRDALREELDHTATAVHGAVQQDVIQLEQSIATNVTRMAQGSLDAVARVGHDVDSLGGSVERLERGVHGEFERVESQLRTAIERVEQTLREELVEPTETVKKLDEELPARFNRVERTLLEQVQSTQRDLSAVLSSLVDANRAAADRITALSSTIDDDRARRTDDVELIVDTVTTGWEGLAGAVKALFEQGEENSRRISGIEQRLSQIRDLEGAIEETMERFQAHVQDLQPAPIVVTVAHPEAEVRNTARAGWLPAGSS